MPATDFDAIPVIDLTDARSPDLAARQKVASAIHDACVNVGFFYVKNHRVDESVVAETFKQAHDFFAQPAAVKASVDISKSDMFRGFVGLLKENNDPKNKGELHEGYNLGLETADDPVHADVAGSGNLWPRPEVWPQATKFRLAVLRYYAQVMALGQSLFPLFALALDLPESFFDDKTRKVAAIMRLLWYPALGDAAIDDLTPGIGPHTDFECFTILRQDDVPALQVQNMAGDWIDATYIPETFIINIGDQFARWTNDEFVSTRHRALPATTRDRYSIPFFFGCDPDVRMEPIPTCVSAERPNKYEVMTAGNYVHMRMAEVYTVT
ncbi:hypothetical protein Q5752_006105 [Cryptotrichosporon argae]